MFSFVKNVVAKLWNGNPNNETTAETITNVDSDVHEEYTEDDINEYSDSIEGLEDDGINEYSDSSEGLEDYVVELHYQLETRRARLLSNIRKREKEKTRHRSKKSSKHRQDSKTNPSSTTSPNLKTNSKAKSNNDTGSKKRKRLSHRTKDTVILSNDSNNEDATDDRLLSKRPLKRSKTFENSGDRKEKDTEIKKGMTNSGPSYYCPYKGCTKEYTSPYLIYKHSREIHNSELATPTKSTFFKSSSGKVINFKINDRNSLDPGEKILLVQKNDQTYYCPYKGCTKECGSRRTIYNHSRAVHNSELPTSNMSPRPQLFMSSSGKVIDFKINDRNLLDPGEKILLVQKNGQTYYCPYKGCTKECGLRRTIYKHSRVVHNSELPTPNMGPRSQLFMSSSGKIIDFKINDRNSLDPGEKILRVSPTLYDVNYYCPYENCQYQAQQSFNALPNHIRKYHFKDLPAEILIKDYVLETMSGDIINIEDPECRNTVEANQEILIRYKDPAQDRRTNLQLRCPYKNCTTKYSNRSAVYVHLRAAHSVPIPHLSRGGQNKYICRESSGKVLSFGVGQDELLDLENEISVEVISRTRWSIRNK